MTDDISKENVCLERCYFKAENCYQNEDGTWDCETEPEDCIEHCRGKH